LDKVPIYSRNRSKETPLDKMMESENKNFHVDVESNGLLYTLEETNKNEFDISI